MNSHICILCSVLAVSIGSRALAQDSESTLPVQFHFEAGGSLATGALRDDFKDGWNVGAGVTVHPAPELQPFAIRLDGYYNQFNARSQVVTQGGQYDAARTNWGTTEIAGGDLDAVLEGPLHLGDWAAQARGYILAGASEAWRRIDLSQTALRFGSYCDGFLAVCQGATVPGTTNAARLTTTRFGWNAGLGIRFPLPDGRSWFIEGRYNRLDTPLHTSYIPIRIGYRF